MLKCLGNVCLYFNSKRQIKYNKTFQQIYRGFFADVLYNKIHMYFYNIEMETENPEYE